jgi:hypothetical protein
MTRWFKLALFLIVLGSSLVLGLQIDFERTLNPGNLVELLQS